VEEEGKNREESGRNREERRKEEGRREEGIEEKEGMRGGVKREERKERRTTTARQRLSEAGAHRGGPQKGRSGRGDRGNGVYGIREGQVVRNVGQRVNGRETRFKLRGGRQRAKVPVRRVVGGGHHARWAGWDRSRYGCYVYTQPWVGGRRTNHEAFRIWRRRYRRRQEEIVSGRAGDETDFAQKRPRTLLKKERRNRRVSEITPWMRCGETGKKGETRPGRVIVRRAAENRVCLKESRLCGIPTVARVDATVSTSLRKRVTYPRVSNVDSVLFQLRLKDARTEYYRSRGEKA
jgi:Ribosomal protein S2